MSFLSSFSPLLKTTTSLLKFQSPSLIAVRTMMKTHKGAAKRWRRNSTSFKRGIAGRNHGNGGWSRRGLKVLSGRKTAHKTHIKHLKKLLPFS
ncbi:Mrp35 protein [Maudiozyma humilis]|uniref:Mrp35 protein n=1 Tax=Maudiozyma humilis TaxID=51915 RepID=A0AAV5RS24_MAUHU|nr:Mrp35 protein [Kazachstania humilis]